MYLKDLLNDKPEEKDVGVLLDKGMFNLLSHITQTALFSTNPGTVLKDINRKKNMKKDKFASTIFLTSKDIRDKGAVGYGNNSYSIDLFKRAFEEASKAVGDYQIYINKVYFNVLRNTVDFCFGIKDDGDDSYDRYDRDIKSGRVNLTFYRVRIVLPDKYKIYGAQNNIRGTNDAEYADEYAIYENVESFKYIVFVKYRDREELLLIDSISLNSEYKEIPDTYELSGEDEDEDEDEDGDEDEYEDEDEDEDEYDEEGGR